jgi:hypothetical protein
MSGVLGGIIACDPGSAQAALDAFYASWGGDASGVGGLYASGEFNGAYSTPNLYGVDVAAFVDLALQLPGTAPTGPNATGPTGPGPGGQALNVAITQLAGFSANLFTELCIIIANEGTEFNYL